MWVFCLLVCLCLWRPEEGIRPPETVVRGPRSSGRAVCAFNHWAFFLAPFGVDYWLTWLDIKLKDILSPYTPLNPGLRMYATIPDFYAGCCRSKLESSACTTDAFLLSCLPTLILLFHTLSSMIWFQFSVVWAVLKMLKRMFFTGSTS